MSNHYRENPQYDDNQNHLANFDLKEASGVLLTPLDFEDLQSDSDRFNQVIIINKDVIREIGGGENNLTTNSRAVR